MPFQLPTYNGYTIDKRLRQFRKVAREAHEEFPGIEFIEFNSKKGQELLAEIQEYFDFLWEE